MFGFPDIERSKFENNFLRSVSVTISFEPCNAVLDTLSTDSEVLAETPHRSSNTISELRVGTTVKKFYRQIHDNEIVLKSDNEETELRISESAIGFTLIVNEYSGFESIESKIFHIIDVLKETGVENVKKIVVKKLNLLNFKLSSTGDDEGMLPRLSPINDLLIPGLVPTSASVIKVNNHIVLTSCIIKLCDDGGFFMEISPATIVDTDTANDDNVEGCVSIDITAKSTHSLPVDDVKERIGLLNEEIFKAFYWMLSNKGKSLLSNGD